jgi:hypothetical protein
MFLWTYLRLEIVRYNSDDTVIVAVLLPEGSAGNVIDKKFGHKDITEPGTDTERIWYF